MQVCTPPADDEPSQMLLSTSSTPQTVSKLTLVTLISTSSSRLEPGLTSEHNSIVVRFFHEHHFILSIIDPQSAPITWIHSLHADDRNYFTEVEPQLGHFLTQPFPVRDGDGAAGTPWSFEIQVCSEKYPCQHSSQQDIYAVHRCPKSRQA